MNKIQQRASVHESTIQQIAREALPRPEPDPSNAPTGPGFRSRVRTAAMKQGVHDQVWREVEKILDSGHGYTTCERISATEMVVR